jgi:kynurenine 3-monooxygenase
MQKVSIIGAGLVGSLLSVMMAKKGYKVNMFERRPDMRKVQISAGRSINLALSDRGWKALEAIGAADIVKENSIAMFGRMIHQTNGDIKFQPYGETTQAIYSVSRGGLNCMLMDLAEKNGVNIEFEERCNSIDINTCKIDLENINSFEKKSVAADHIFSADGASSVVRSHLEEIPTFMFEQSQLFHGYKELSIPANEDGNWRLEKNALHIWPRGDYMLIALPNIDGSFTCTLFFPYEGKNSFASLQTEGQVSDFFERVFPDAKNLMSTLLHDFFSNPTSALTTIKCFPWSYKDKILLLGDAAHAIVPFYGQGMNCGFEDCTVLNDLLNHNENDFNTIFKQFETLRKPNADAIAELAMQNFVEMRDSVGNPQFLKQKKIESMIHERYPDIWIPLYSMVTFSHIPYKEALNEGKKQQAIMDKLMLIDNLETDFNKPEIQAVITKELQSLNRKAVC